MDMSSFQHMEKLLKEDTEGEFEIQGMLGRGGMAVVFLASENKLGRKVAIKVLPPELTFGHGVDRFMREAKTAAALDHPNIIPIYRIGSGSKLFWYAMKFLEGRSLDDLMKEKGKLTVDEVIPILEQVGDALDYAHQHNVIHRDMKPANVMLDHRNRVIVTDFGIAKALTEQTLTASGSVVGTPYYMSPEQGMGTGVSGRSDQYSVGVMAYRMLSGQFPFEGDSAIDILHKHCMIPPSPLEFIQPGLPKHVYLAVHKALEKKGERRFSSVSAFAAALKAPTAELETSGEVSSEGATIALSASAVRGGRPGASGATPPTPVPAASGAKTVLQTPATPAPRPSAASRAKSKGVRGVVITLAAVLAIGGGVGGYIALSSGSGAKTDAGSGQGSQPAGGAPAVPGQAAAPPASGGAQPAPTSAAPTTGRVSVTGLPAGGTITVDGRQQRGNEFDLTPGAHQVRMAAAGFAPVQTTITVEAGVRTTLPFNGQRVARIEPSAQPTVPSGGQPTTAVPPKPAGPSPTGAAQLAIVRIAVQPPANVTINNVNKGQQARIVDTLVPGTAILKFEKDGYLPIDTTVTLKAGDVVTLQIKLVVRP